MVATWQEPTIVMSDTKIAREASHPLKQRGYWPSLGNCRADSGVSALTGQNTAQGGVKSALNWKLNVERSSDMVVRSARYMPTKQVPVLSEGSRCISAFD
jgi:hypothetical protein